MTNLGGAPSKYTDEVKLKIAEYLEAHLDNNDVPSVAGLAVFLSISKKTLYNWGEDDPGLLHTLETLKNIQEAKLLKGGLNGTYNATIVKLMLANHGYRDRQDITSDDKSISPILVEFVNKDDSTNNSDTN